MFQLKIAHFHNRMDFDSSVVDNSSSSYSICPLNAIPLLDQVAEKLMSNGIIDFSHKFVTSKGLVLPKTNSQQRELIDNILDALRVKSVPNQKISFEFTLRDLFQHVKENHPTVKIQLFGSFINYYLSQDHFVDALLDRLSLSEYKSELKSRFQQEPGDLDIRFFLPDVEDPSQVIGELQNTIHHYFLNKIPEGYRHAHRGIYTKFIDPHHPSYFALIGIAVNEEEQGDFSNTLDLYIDYLSGIRIWADALFLDLSSISEKDYTLISECPSGVWQSIIDRIISICQIERQHLDRHYHASNLNLYYLSKLYTKGYRCEDPETEKRVFLLDNPEKYAMLSRGASRELSCPPLDYLTLKKFEKHFSLNPGSSFPIFFQASLTLLSYNSTNNIATLWKIYTSKQVESGNGLEFTLAQCLSRYPHLFPHVALFLTLHALEVHNGSAVSSVISKASWTTHLQVPFLQIEIEHSTVLIPVDWHLQRNSFAEWNHLTDDERVILSPLIQLLFPNASNDSSAIINKIHHLEADYFKFILERINQEIATLTKNSHLLSKESASKVLEHFIKICVNEDQHRILAKAIDLLSESEIPFNQIWMRALVESEQPKNWNRSLEIYKELPNDFTKKEGVEQVLVDYFVLLWKRDPHLVYQTLEKNTSFDFVHHILIEICKWTDCLSDSNMSNWMLNQFLENKNLDNILSFIKGPLFAKLIETNEDLAFELLKKVSKRGAKRESLPKLVDTGLILLKSTEKLSFSGALLLSYISEFLPNKTEPKIVSQWNKMSELLSSKGKMHELVNLWSWGRRAKVQTPNLDQEATRSHYKAVSIFVKKGNEDIQKMKDWNPLFKFPNDDKIFTYQLQEDYKTIVKSLVKGQLYKEALDWLLHMNSSLENEQDLAKKNKYQLYYFEILQECIPSFQEESSLQEALQLLLKLSSHTEAVELASQLLLDSTILSYTTKCKILTGLLKDKNAVYKKAISSLLQSHPIKSLILLKGLAEADNSPFLPLIQLALPLLQDAGEEIQASWKPIIRSAVLTSQRSDFLNSISTIHQCLFDNSPTDTEVIQAFLQKEWPIPSTHHVQALNVCKEIINKGSLQSSIKWVLLFSKQDFFAKNINLKEDLLSHLLLHILSNEQKYCDAKVVHVLQQLLKENVELKEKPSFVSICSKYASQFQLDFQNEMKEIAELYQFKISLTPDIKVEIIRRERIRFSELLKQKPHQNLSVFREFLPYLTTEDIQALVENVLNNQSKIERFELILEMLLSLSNVSIETWTTFFEFLSQKFANEEDIIHPICSLSYRILDERLYPYFSSRSTITPRELSFLLYYVILLPATSANKFLKKLLENSDEYIQLFNDPTVDRKVRNQVYVQMIIKTAAVLPFYNSDEARVDLDKWRSLTRDIKEVASGGNQNEENLDWVACQAWISIGEIMAISRAGNPDEFKNLQREIYLLISMLFNSDLKQIEITKHYQQFVAYFTTLLQFANDDRKVSMLLWASSSLSLALENYRIFKFNFFQTFVTQKYLDFNNPCISEILETLSDDLIKIGENPVMEERLSPNILNTIALRYLTIIKNIHWIPFNQRSFEQNQVFLKAIKSFIDFRFQQSDSLVAKGEVALYKMIDDAEAMKVVLENPEKQAQTILYFLLKLKVVSKCLSRLGNDPMGIDRKMAIEFLDSLKAFKFDDTLSKENYFMLLSQLVCFPIPDNCLSESWSGIPTRMAIQLIISKSRTNPGLFIENPIEAFKVAYPLGLYGNIPQEITIAQLLLAIKELNEEILISNMSNINHLKLGLKIFNIPVEGESYNQNFQDKIEALRIEYPVIYFYTLLQLCETWPKGMFHIKNSENYYGPMIIRLIDMIGNDQERLMKVVALMEELVLELQTEFFDALYQSLQFFAFNSSVQDGDKSIFIGNFIQIMLRCGRIVVPSL